MKLNYNINLSGSQCLRSGSIRIELHLCKLDQKLRSLVMLSGQDNALPKTSQQQGPYHSSAQAQAALNAITKELISRGFYISEERLIWQINAQSLLKKNKSTREKHATDTTFTPLGPPPEQP